VTAPGLLGNDSSPSGNPLTAIKVTDPANGTLTLNTNGSFTYTPNSTFSGTDTFTYKASDGASASNAATVSITVAQSGGSSISIWSPSTVPGTADANDNAAVELGLKFQTSVSGSVLGVRFYKGPLNTGTHIGNLWSSNGTLLATATFVNESASGWQQVNFATPVSISANTTYIVSYFAPQGEYAFDANFFASSGVTNGPLHALATSQDSGGNGVFHYGGSSSFPSQTFNAANYWVDVVFTQ
jgi:VCBS repeat-containing protein